MTIRLRLALNTNRQITCQTLLSNNNNDDDNLKPFNDSLTQKSLLTVAKNKLNLKKKPSRLFLPDHAGLEPISTLDFWSRVSNDSLILISMGEDYIGAVGIEKGGGKHSDSTTTTGNSSSYQLPQVKMLNDESILILTYPNSKALKDAVGRPHVYYEGGVLKGPLKGVNFPLETLQNRAAETTLIAAAATATASKEPSNDNNDESTLKESLQSMSILSPSPDESRTAINSSSSNTPHTSSSSCSSSSNQQQQQQLSSPPFTTAELHVLTLCGLQPIESSSLKATYSTTKPTAIKYIIATLTADTSTLTHELAHAKFHMSNDYKQKCFDLFHNHLDPDFQKHIKRELVQVWGYKDHMDTIVDEFQAYVKEADFNVFGKKWKTHVERWYSLLSKD